jgi:pantothenate kinase
MAESSAVRTPSSDPVRLSTGDLVARVREMRRAPRSVLGITGAPGSGKSTLAAALLAVLPREVAVVGMDGFHLAQAELERLGRHFRKGAPDTFDAFGYAALLRRLRDNVEPTVYAPLFRRDLEEPIGSCVPIDRDVAVVVTEGNYLLLDEPGWIDARRAIDEVWFLDLPDDVRVERLVRRHQEFGKTPADARAWATGSDQHNAVVVERGRERADLVIRLLPD